MDDLYQRIVKDRRGFTWLAGKLPGFAGYMEMTSRRTADRLIRDHVAGQLKSLLTQLASIETDMIRGGGVGYMSATKSAKTKFQTLIDRIATDAPGYSGFFAAVRIGGDELENIYAFDEAMLRYAESIGAALEQLSKAASANDGISQAISNLDTLMQEANAAYDLREDILKGIA